MTEQEIFTAAIRLTGDARAKFLAQACGVDTQLRQQVEALLKAHDESGGIVPRQMGRDLDPTLIPPQAVPQQIVQPGTMIGGRYKLIEAIGEGGMGTVWMAEQKEPVKRKVAVKLVKAGMDSAQVLSRFEAERQALALMDHPNIARVFDGGMTDQGRPYFVMEFVKGVPLTEYCDQARLSLKDRLNLFIPVCQAIQHAHQKGIIHRDLKPSNILICLYDGKPVPKVIDFGLAKALHQSLTEQTLHTAFGMMVGTPLYMSPEQAEHNNLDVDTRTDIYSLGVILYELLTGSTPLERQQLKKAAYNEILRLIKEVEPPKPSTRISGSVSLPSIAAQRSIEPHHLKKSLTGDLDWIVMKALDKERSRRYETAIGFARDVERFLNDQAIDARPPSNTYRLQKLIRRHRKSLAVFSAFVFVLFAGTTISIWQAIRATQANHQAQLSANEALAQKKQAIEERDQKEKALEAESAARVAANQALLAAEQAKKSEQSRAEELKQVVDFQGKMLSDIRISLAGQRMFEDLTAEYSKVVKLEVTDEAERSRLDEEFKKAIRKINSTSVASNMVDQTILRPALEAIDKQFAHLPLVRASLQESIAIVYIHSLGNCVAGEQLADKIVRTRTEVLGADHRDTLRAELMQAEVQYWQAKLDHHVAQARSVLERSRQQLGPDDRITLQAMKTLGDFLYDSEEGLTLIRDCYQRAVTLFRDEDRLTIEAGYVLAFISLNRPIGSRAEKLQLSRKVYEAAERSFGPDDPITSYCSYTLAWAMLNDGNLLAAEPFARHALDQHQRVFREEHVHAGFPHSCLAEVYWRLGRRQEATLEAEAYLQQSLRTLGAAHTVTRWAFNRLTDYLVELGRYSDLMKIAKSYFARLRADGSDSTHQKLIRTTATFSDRIAGGVPDEERIILLQAAITGDEFATSVAADRLFDILFQNRRLDEARGLLRRSRQQALNANPTLDSVIASIVRHLRLGEFQQAQGMIPRLNETLEKTTEVTAKSNALTSIGQAYIAAGHRPEGLRFLEQAWESTRDPANPSAQRVSVASKLANAYRMENRQVDARKILLVLRPDRAELDRSLLSVNVTNDHGCDDAFRLRGELLARADLLLNQGLPEDSIEEYEAALFVQEKLIQGTGDRVLDRRDQVPLLFRYGVALLRLKRLNEAERLLDQAIAIREAQCAESPENIDFQQLRVAAYRDRGLEYVAAGRPELSGIWFGKAVEAAQGVPQVELVLLSIAHSLRSQNKNAEAITLLESLQERCQATLGSEIPIALQLYETLAGAYDSAGRSDEAYGTFRRALELRNTLTQQQPDVPQFASAFGGTYNNLARIDLNASRFSEARERLVEAIGWQRKALDSSPGNLQFRLSLVNHYMNLIRACQGLKDAASVADARRKLAELHSCDPRFEVLDARLLAIRDGEAAKDNPERLTFARRAYDTGHFVLATKLLTEALNSDAKLGEDRKNQVRYDGACYAVLAASGAGNDDGSAIDDAARMQLRKKAFDWLTAELEAWSGELGADKPETRAFAARALAHWHQDSDLTAIREPAELSKLLESERADWEALWKRVDELRGRATELQTQSGPKAAIGPQN